MIDDPTRAPAASGTAAVHPADIILALLVITVLMMWGMFFRTALAMVENGEVALSAALASALATVLLVAGALRRLVWRSTATVFFGVTAALFAWSSWQWGWPYIPARIAASGALVALVALALPRRPGKVSP